MSEATFASLGPTLLARKGGAKPAMRPQLAPLPEQFTPEQLGEDALEDLGWNDMGSEDDADDANANVVALNSASAVDQPRSPVVKRQQKDLSDRVLANAVMEGPTNLADSPAEAPATPKKSNKPAKSSAAHARRAAFTLRLDADRHLKLRLAATMKGVSAQALVTKALDSLLDQIEDLSALAERMKRN
jgi:hypothetical protein